MWTVGIISWLKYQPPTCYMGAARLSGPRFGDVIDECLVRAGRKGHGKGLFASSLQAFIWPTAAKKLGTSTLNSWSPACSLFFGYENSWSASFSVSQAPESDIRITYVTKNTVWGGNRMQEESRSINSSWVWQGFPARQKATDEWCSQSGGLFFLASLETACFPKHPSSLWTSRDLHYFSCLCCTCVTHRCPSPALPEPSFSGS